MKRAMALSALLVLAGCGGSAEDKPAKAEKQKTQREDAQERKCVQTLEPLNEALAETASRVTVGLNYEAYTKAAGDVRVAYDQVDIPSLKGACAPLAGVPLEIAAQKYVRALEVWTKCFEDIDCENDSIQPDLERLWSQADKQLDLGKTGLKVLAAPG